MQELKEEETIDMEMVIQEWKTAQTNRERYTTDFVSLDNIVDGVPLSHQTGSPYVADTTLAGLVRFIPKASLQQIPVFGAAVNGTKQSQPALICSYLLRRAVFNEDTFGKGLLSTMQIGCEEALTHGYAPFMTATGKMLNDYGTTMRLLHYSDVDPEPGVMDANEASYFYVGANLTKSRVQKILRAARENEATSWNIEALEELIEMPPETKSYTQYQSDPKRKNELDSQTYLFITRYESGKGGQFVTFCPQIEDKPLRVIENKSKFGYPRVQFLVLDPAALSPFGTSRVRLASPFQNLMNIFLQNIASMLLLNSRPPILQRGRFTTPLQLKQDAKWTTLDQNAKAELITLDNGALAQFPQFSGQFSAQMQNMMGITKGGINANQNSLGYSKTGPGVKQQTDDQNLSNNQITKILESFLRQYALVALDTHISEQSGEEELIVDDECKNAINRLAESKFVPQPNLEVDPTGQTMTEFIPPIGDDNKITINWDDFYEGIEDWSISIELGVSKDEMEEKARGDVQDMLVTMTQNANPNDMAKQAKISELEDRLLEKTVPESARITAGAVAPVTPQPVQNAQPPV